jgi:hypothetical protein
MPHGQDTHQGGAIGRPSAGVHAGGGVGHSGRGYRHGGYGYGYPLPYLFNNGIWGGSVYNEDSASTYYVLINDIAPFKKGNVVFGFKRKTYDYVSNLTNAYIIIGNYKIPASFARVYTGSKKPVAERISSFADTTANYIFVEAFSTRVSASAAGRTGRDTEGEGDGKITLRYKVGDKVEGTEYPEGQYLVTMPYANLFVNIPYTYLKKVNVATTTNATLKYKIIKDIRDKTNLPLYATTSTNPSPLGAIVIPANTIVEGKEVSKDGGVTEFLQIVYNGGTYYAYSGEYELYDNKTAGGANTSTKLESILTTKNVLIGVGILAAAYLAWVAMNHFKFKKQKI